MPGKRVKKGSTAVASKKGIERSGQKGTAKQEFDLAVKREIKQAIRGKAANTIIEGSIKTAASGKLVKQALKKLSLTRFRKGGGGGGGFRGGAACGPGPGH